jgi:phospholipid/cholesterol/gamma-HCH transport system permease protein
MRDIFRSWLAELGGLALLGADALRQAFRRPFERPPLGRAARAPWRAVADDHERHAPVHGAWCSPSPTAYSLSSYGGESFVGNLLALAIVRELGPVLTALMVAGRVGAGITAEIGSMTVTEQVDALRVLAASP